MTTDAALAGFQVGLKVERDVIEDRRDRRRDRYLAVGDAEKLGHDERGRPHHGGHELAAG
jgi:hypothetical protein